MSPKYPHAVHTLTIYRGMTICYYPEEIDKALKHYRKVPEHNVSLWLMHSDELHAAGFPW